MSELHKAQTLLSIIDVCIRSTTVTVREDIDLPDLNHDSTATYSFRKPGSIVESEVENDETKDIFWIYKFEYAVGIRLAYEGEKEKEDGSPAPILEILTKFVSRYVSHEKLNQESLEAFSENNVGFNIWPYWREYVQSTCARVGLSPILSIPFYRMPKKEPTAVNGTE